MREDTPPSSPYRPENINPIEDDDVVDGEDDLVYYGTLDEFLENEGGEPEFDEDQEMDEELNEEPVRDDALITFSAHTSAIFCGSFHPTENWAVTGGEDDRAFVWNCETGEVLYEVQGHTDSVIAAEFSYDGVYLATGDMAGDIQVFKVAQNYKKVWEYSMGDMAWMKWHLGANVLMGGSEAGETYIWRIPSGDCKVLQGHGFKSEVATLTADGKKLAVGYGDGGFKLWDIKANHPVLEVKSGENPGHSEAVISVAPDCENNLFITGSEDGKALIIGPSGPLGALNPDSGSVEAVLIDCPDFDIKVAATGTLNGKLVIWDIARQSIRTTCKDDEPVGITRMIWLKNQTILAGTLNGTLKAWDVRSGELKYILLGHTNNIHDICLHRSKDKILTVSDDSKAKIFNIIL